MIAKACAVIGVGLLAMPPAISADPHTWASVPENSELRYTAYYEGEELAGRFSVFRVTVETSAETGAPSSLTVEVETRSADMNDREINAEILEPEWFDATTYPNARFESDEIRAADEGLVAVGRLRLKGSDESVEVPLDWRRDGDSATLAGSLRMSRQRWAIGTGEWSSDASLADRVDVSWRVTLVPAE